MSVTGSDKSRLVKVCIRRMEPLGHVHTYSSFSEADRHLFSKCRTLETDFTVPYSYEVAWENGRIILGDLVIDNDMTSKDCIIQDCINSILANDLLLYTLEPDRNKLISITLRLQWQMERLMLDQQKKDYALAIITECEGVDEEKILASYELLRKTVESVDMFLPLLKKVFPNARQKLESIRSMKNRSNIYRHEAVKRYQGLASAVLSAALNNEQERFESSWQKLVDFCIQLSEEQRYADERLTSLGRELYLLGASDTDLITQKAGGHLRPFSEDSSQEFRLRDKKIKQAFFKTDERVPKKGNRKVSKNGQYMELYANVYAKKEGAMSRQSLSEYVAGVLLSKYRMTADEVKSLIMSHDPMAVQFPSYPDIVVSAVCNS